MSTTSNTEPVVVPGLTGKTIASANIIKDQSGDEKLILEFTDGSAMSLSCSQREGYPVELSVFQANQ